MLRNNRIFFCFMIVFSALFLACSRDLADEVQTEVPNGYIRFTVNTASPKLPERARAKTMGMVPESQISEIIILVFENGFYRYSTEGLSITQSSEYTTFLARLQASNVPTTLYVIANNNALVDANEPAVGSPIESVKSSLILDYTHAGVSGNVGLWGSYFFEEGVKVNQHYALDPIPLLRAVARVDVQIGSTASDFKLSSIQVFRASGKIQILPNAFENGKYVISPSIPAGSLNTIRTDVIPSTSDYLSQGQLYLPESDASMISDKVNEATCVIVGGKYKDGVADRYYRLDFHPNMDAHPFGQILRNHRYLFLINEVENNGFATPEEAASQPSSGMEAGLLVWNDNEHLNIYYDNLNFFALEKKEVDLPGTINASEQISVYTDVDTYQMRFTDGLSPWASNLDDGTFRITQANQGKLLIFTTLQDNTSGGEIRKRVVEISAMNIKSVYITVSQLTE